MEAENNRMNNDMLFLSKIILPLFILGIICLIFDFIILSLILQLLVFDGIFMGIFKIGTNNNKKVSKFIDIDIIPCKYIKSTFSIFGIIFVPKDTKVETKYVKHKFINKLQAQECGWFLYYFLYFFYWIISGFRYKKILFEQEAFEYDDNFDYIVSFRERYNWLR
jgi:hypothetical protein